MRGIVFEDIDNRKEAVQISPQASDRVLVYAIWTRNAAGALPVDRAWAVLSERYSDDARFLLLHAYEEVVAPRDDGAWTPSTFLTKVRKVLDAAGGRLNPEVRDLIAVAEDDLHPLSEEDAAHLERIRARVTSMRRADSVASKKRLQRLATDVIRELHDRTNGDKPIGRTSTAPAAIDPASEWKKAVSEAKGKRSTYSATAKVSAGDVLEHPKFGAGVVLSVEPGRAHILFESGARKLVCG